ncbi:hypothetical protein B0A55_05805 [Friedmanniomyces simplex]|uniref:Uncharacterized protein n=1 Tax=Friedmanniomyces simplex TaxID=329884 RepID=A0A4U0XSN1_9PEZI|nr:hypothetical protein B0A55_05805 [Friedmanniomyces simplex]
MSSSDYESVSSEKETPQKRTKARPQQRTPKCKHDEASRTPKSPPADPDPTLQSRLACLDKTQELNAIPHKDAGALAMIAAICKLANEQPWQKLVIYRSRHLPEYPEAHDDETAWETYEYARWEVVSRLLDFVFFHIEIVVALGRVEYRSLWVYTQYEESIPARILAFVDFLTTKSDKLSWNRDIVIRKWAADWDVAKWIEVFQVDTAAYQEEEELLDFRIW